MSPSVPEQVANLFDAVRVAARLEMDRLHSGNKWCRHYAGMYRVDACRAGVRYAEVKGPGQFNYPCFKDRCENTSCSQQSFLTDVEAWQQIVDARARITEYVTKVALNVCPICEKPVERQRQVGPCVYADPCGHRLYQGRAKRRSKSA